MIDTNQIIDGSCYKSIRLVQELILLEFDFPETMNSGTAFMYLTPGEAKILVDILLTALRDIGDVNENTMN